jgi:hypothetical protein
MYAPTRICVHGAVQGMRGVEPEFLAEFVHQRMPINLCVCRERRHRGWSKQ